MSWASGESEVDNVCVNNGYRRRIPLNMASKKVFREVLPSRIASASSAFPKFRRDVIVNTGAAQGTLQDIKRPEACGGYAYKDSALQGQNDVCTRNRFIYWKVNHDVLELSEESLDCDLLNGHVAVRFQDTPVLDGVSVHENGDVDVVVLVATVSSVHRIVLPHPRRLDASKQSVDQQYRCRQFPSIFTELTTFLLRDSSTYHVLNLSSGASSPAPHTSACWLSAYGSAHFTLASISGSVLHIRLPPYRHSANQKGVSTDSEVIVTELRKSNVIRRVLSSVVPSVMRGGLNGQAQDAPLSLCFDASIGPRLLFTLCRDCCVRVWSIDDQQCLMEFDLVPFMTDHRNQNSVTGRIPLTGQRHVLKKSSEGDFKESSENGILLVAALHFAEYRSFIIMRLSSDDDKPDGYNLVHVMTASIGHTHDLIDFVLTPTHLWALWLTSCSETVVSYIAMGTTSCEPSVASNWMNAILQPTECDDFYLPEDVADPREEYCERIFYPGRFSLNTISKAIFNTFRRSADMSHASEFGGSNIASLREEVTAAVEMELQNCASEYEVADDVYVQLQQECWAKFYSGCVQFHQVEMEPMGLFVGVNTDLVYFIKKNCLSVLRPCDYVEMCSTLEQHSLEQYLNPPFAALFRCLAEVRCRYSVQMIHDFKFDLYHLGNPDAIAHIVVDDIFRNADSDSESQCVYVDEKLKELIQMAIGHLPSAIEELLDAIDLTPMASSRDTNFLMDTMADDDRPNRGLLRWSESHLFASRMGASLLAESVHQVAEAHFDVCRDLLVLLTIITEAASELGISMDVIKVLHSRFVQRTCLLTWAYFIVTWICKAVAVTSTDTVDESMRHLGLLKLSDSVQPSRSLPTSDSSSSRLIEIFVRHEGGHLARSHLARTTTLIEVEGRRWTDSFSQIVSLLMEQVWPVTVNCLFLECLLAHKQYAHIQEYDRLLGSWCEMNSCSRKFACGYSHLVHGRPHAAVDCFEVAADGPLHEEFLASRLNIQPDGDPSEGVVLFYCKCIRLLEQFQQAEHVIQMAEKAVELAGRDSTHLSTLQTLLFKYYLELGRNKDAFAAMLANPDHTRRLTCLRQFVVVLFERQQLKALIEFSYKDLEDEVVEIMEQRARTIDLNVNNYYELLFSFHTVRGNSRRAASMMYEYGIRMGSECGGLKGLQQQVKCYLAAMNSLELVDPNYQWLVTPVHADNARETVTHTQPGASPKRSSDGEELIRPHLGIKPQVALIELKDIRLEYELILARLQLIWKDLDPSIAQGPCPTPEEMVTHLSKAGLFNKAIRICKAFSVPMQPVIETLVNKCVHLARATSRDTPVTFEEWDWLSDNEISGQQSSQDNSVCDHAWLLLRSYIEQHEPKGQTVLLKCAAVRMLSLGFRLPHWLLASYKARDVASLLRIYLRFGLLEDAALLTLEYIDGVLGHGKEYFGLETSLATTSPSVWMPFTAIDTVREALNRNQTDLTLASLKDAISERLMNYFGKVERVSKEMMVNGASATRDNTLISQYR